MRHLITGATGFLGSALAVELLAADSNNEVVCLSRAKKGVSASARTLAAIEDAARSYGTELDPGARVTVVAGDLDELPDVPGGADVAWHTAASLKYHDRDRAEIEETNVAAVARLVDWLPRQGVRRIQHFSTAYVAGERGGECTELADFAEFPPNNVYEESKRAGERIVRAAGLEWQLLRPSIIVGHSRTRRAMSDSGIYGFYRSAAEFKERVAEVFGDLYSNVPMHLQTDPDALLNLIPIDRCVRAAVHAQRDLDPYTVTHLVNESSPSIGDSLRECFEILGWAAPTFVDQPGLLSDLDRKFSRQIEFYAPYLRQDKQFAQADDEIRRITTGAVTPHDVGLMLRTYATDRDAVPA